MDLSSRDFLRAASFARLASRSARRRSAAEMAPVLELIPVDRESNLQIQMGIGQR